VNVLYCTSKWIGRGTLPSASLSAKQSSNGPFSDENLTSYPFMYAPKVRFAAEVECQVQKAPRVCTVCLYTHTQSAI